MHRIRQATVEDALAIARVHIASWRSTYRGILPDLALAALNVGERTRLWANILRSSEGTLIAELEKEVVGFASFGPIREPMHNASAELYAIYLLERAQRKGIGSALVARGMQRMRTLGHKSMLAWVLAKNPAIRFYSALGAVEVTRKQIEMGGILLQEVAFVWRPLPFGGDAA